ncbi:telomeric repeat-binding factor 1 isoform X1 [Periophthalmus magnuspinnatus]|uniref:telomeric repeat-binding factor 1 isoform X1 n=1 Tax=Periophthalmus magnuspinnatus TaxID=409849 RepID=UPI002436F859|nr:telomeric repeat-binding factor 1 isoform X1 [Periophthalmus magnuspinnatus]
MEQETDEKTSSEKHETEEKEDSYSQVTALVTDWMLDFLFVSLCRNFKEGNLGEFNKNLTSFQAISDDLPQNDKVFLCAFLARVMHGKELDVIFEEDHRVSPLMSAAKIWSGLKETVEDESLARNMTILLVVQAVAMCLEKGSNASYTLQWFEKNVSLSSSLRVKLGTVIAQKDIYHPFIQSFSYSRLLETANTVVDLFLEKNPSDYLLKMATKAVQSSKSRNVFKDTGAKDNFQTAPESTTANVNKKSKRKLLSNKICDIWSPETCKQPLIYVERISKNDSTCNVTNITNIKKRKPRIVRHKLYVLVHCHCSCVLLSFSHICYFLFRNGPGKKTDNLFLVLNVTVWDSGLTFCRTMTLGTALAPCSKTDGEP